MTISSAGSILTEAQQQRFIIEDFRPLAESLEWDLGLRYLRERGSKAFLSDSSPVPFVINNDGVLSRQAAETFFSSLVATEKTGPLEPRIFVLELGIGIGLFARFFLDAFKELCAKGGKDYYRKLTYVAGDRSERMLADACRHGVFANHAGHYLIRVVDAMDPRPFLIGDPAIPGEQPFRAVFLNYLLDCLPAADLKIKAGEVSQLCVRTCLARNLFLGEYTSLSPQDIARKARSGSAGDHRDLLELYGLFASEYDYRPVTREADGNGPVVAVEGSTGAEPIPYLDFAVQFAQDRTGHLLHNYGAIRSLEWLLTLLQPGGFILANDYGQTEITREEGFEHQRFSNASFVGINFPLLKAYFADQGKCKWVEPKEDSGRIHSRLLGKDLHEETSKLFSVRFSKEASDWLQKPVETARANLQHGRIEGALAAYHQALDRQPYSAGDAANGPYTVDIAAISGLNAGGQTFTWNINPAVNVTALDDQTSQEGQTVALQVVASETGATLTYSADGLPLGLSINAATGMISGVISSGAALAGPYSATVAVSDGTYSNSVSFNWNTLPATTPAAPVVQLPSSHNGYAGQNVSLNVSATDPAGYVLDFNAENLPDGLSIDPNTGIISGTIADDAVSTTPYEVSVTVDDGYGVETTKTFNWSVTPASLSVMAYPIAATQDSDSGTLTVAAFTTTDTNSQAGDFYAIVNWGDGLSDYGTVQGGNGSFSVTDDHVFADMGYLPLSVTILNDNGAVNAGTAYDTASVTSSLAGGFQLGALTGVSTSLTLAYLPNGPSGNDTFTATINWGDGSSDSTVTLTSAGNGLYQVTGNHSYASIGLYTATIDVTDAYGNSQSTTSTVEVGNLYAGVSGALTLATFTGVSGTSYTVNINWGDGDTGTGTATNVSGVVTITASHTFAVDSIDNTGGVYQVQISVTGGSNTLITTVPVEVTRPPSFMVVSNVPTKLGTTLTSAVLGDFVECDVTDSTAEFSGSINWGDGTTSAGTIQEIGANTGLFEIVGSHTYSTNSTSGLLVNVSQNWGTPFSMIAAASAFLTGFQFPMGPGAEIAAANAPITPERFFKNFAKSYELTMPVANLDTTFGNIAKFRTVKYSDNEILVTIVARSVELPDNADAKGVSMVLNRIASQLYTQGVDLQAVARAKSPGAMKFATLAGPAQAKLLKQIDSDIKNLGSDDFAERDQATKNLDSLLWVPAAVSKLGIAVQNPDSEVSGRAFKILAKDPLPLGEYVAQAYVNAMKQVNIPDVAQNIAFAEASRPLTLPGYPDMFLGIVIYANKYFPTIIR